MTIVEYHATLTHKYLMNKYRKSELAEMQERFAKKISEHMDMAGIPPSDASLTIFTPISERLNTKPVFASAIMRQINYMDMRQIKWCLL